MDREPRSVASTMPTGFNRTELNEYQGINFSTLINQRSCLVNSTSASFSTLTPLTTSLGKSTSKLRVALMSPSRARIMGRNTRKLLDRDRMQNTTWQQRRAVSKRGGAVTPIQCTTNRQICRVP
jgi:hypothetical protein